MPVERRPLAERARVAVEDVGNPLYLSLASPWEIQIKLSVGKLTVARPVRKVVEAEVAAGTFQLLARGWSRILNQRRGRSGSNASGIGGTFRKCTASIVRTSGGG
jgi:PIN domain nuclease of toxin-antitoxin system